MLLTALGPLLLLSLKASSTQPSNAQIPAYPLSVEWSTRQYGPDGPWNAVRIMVGSPAVPLDLYPGSAATVALSLLTTVNSSSSGSAVDSEEGCNTVYNPTLSSSAHSLDTTLNITWNGPSSLPGKGYGSAYADMCNIDGTIVNPCFMSTFFQQYKKYPKISAPIQAVIGGFGLGFNAIESNGTIVSQSSIAGLLADQSISSATYGLQIGSSSPMLVGSLILGGFDQKRVLGDVLTIPFHHTLDYTLDLIQLSTVSVLTNGQLPEEQLYNGSLRVTIDPVSPYMYLPYQMCKNMARGLPVHYDSSIGFFVWNQTDMSLYKNSIDAARYFAFTLQSPYSNDSVTVKLALQLMNLMLEYPITSESTPYFPCFPWEGTDFTLGRAFLQAAYLGANLFPHNLSANATPNYSGVNDGAVWWLGQGAGPSIDLYYDPINLTPNNLTIQGCNESYENSWEQAWQLIQAPSPTASAGPSANNSSAGSISDKGLSKGAQIGIGVGTAIGALCLIAFVVLCFILRNRDSRESTSKQQLRSRGSSDDEPDVESEKASQSRRSSRSKHRKGKQRRRHGSTWRDMETMQYNGENVGPLEVAMQQAADERRHVASLYELQEDIYTGLSELPDRRFTNLPLANERDLYIHHQETHRKRPRHAYFHKHLSPEMPAGEDTTLEEAEYPASMSRAFLSSTQVRPVQTSTRSQAPRRWPSLMSRYYQSDPLTALAPLAGQDPALDEHNSRSASPYL